MTVPIPCHYGENISDESLYNDLVGRNYLDSPLIEVLCKRLITAIDLLEEQKSDAGKAYAELELQYAEMEELKDDYAAKAHEYQEQLEIYTEAVSDLMEKVSAMNER